MPDVAANYGMPLILWSYYERLKLKRLKFQKAEKLIRPKINFPAPHSGSPTSICRPFSHLDNNWAIWMREKVLLLSNWKAEIKFSLLNHLAFWAFMKKRLLFWFILIINLCRHFFCGFEKKVLDQNGPYINKFQTILRNVSLSVILEFFLSSASSSSSSSVVCVLVSRPNFY